MYTVLYIDDEEALLELGKEFLETDGEFTVEISGSADDALHRLSDRRFDCIISDYQMPEKDGITFLKEVRQGFGDIPFILFTGRGREEVVIDAINNGADFYIQKGGEPSAQFAELAHKIRQAVGRKRAESSRILAEHNLKQSEEKYRNILERLQDAYFRTDENGIIIMVNPATVRMYGYGSMEEMIGQPASAFYTGGPEERSEMLRQLKEASGIVNFFGRGRRKDGTTFATSMNVQFIRDEKGQVRGTEATIRDVSERQKAEDELRAAYEQITASEEELRNNLDEIVRAQAEKERVEQNFRSLVKNAPDAIYIQVNNRFVYLNRAAVRLFGAASADDLLGKNPWDRIHPSFHEIVKNRVRSVTIDHAVPETLDEVFLKLDGTPVDVAVTGVPYVYEGREGVLVTLHDISDRKRDERDLRAAYEKIAASEEVLRSHLEEMADAQAALAKSEKNFRYVVENAPDAIFTEVDDRFLFLNKAAARMFGAESPGQLVGTSVYDRIHPSFHAEVRDRVLRLTVDKVPVRNLDEVYVRLDGTTVDVEVTAVPYQSEGRPGALVMLRDITERKRAEEALFESRQMLQTVLDNIPQRVFWKDRNLTFLGCNLPLARDVGFSDPAGIVGKTDYDHASHSLAERFRADDRQVMESGVPRITYEESQIRPDGSTAWLLTSKVPLRNRNGDIIGILGTYEDITEKKNREEALRESEEKYRTLVEKANEAITIIQDGRIVFANPMMADLVGIPADTLIGKEYINTVWPDDRDLLLDRHRRRMAGEQVPDTYDFRMIGPDGTVRWIHLTVALIQWHGRHATLNMMSDITERKRAEEQVKNSEIKFSTIFRTNPVALTLVSAPDGIFIDVNDAFLRNTGYSRGEVIGKKPRDLSLFIDPAEMKRFSDQLREYGHVQGMEIRVRRKDKTANICRFFSRIILLDNTPHILSVVEDITDKHRAEEMIRQVNKRLSLLSGITRHDIRNQLMMLDGHVALLKKKISAPDTAGHISRIEAASSRIAGMIQFTKEYEMIGVHAPAWKDIRGLADAAGRDAAHGNVRIQNDLPAGTEVFADPLITKVFFNLIDNAQRHGEKVSTIRFSLSDQDGKAVIVCEDDGCGISNDDKKKIFDRGFGKNTGYGLALSREILEITGITIQETGTPGMGARFEILVPAGDIRNTGTTPE